MFKRDRIFFVASGVFALGLLLAVFNLNLALLFVVGAYLLRPTLHAFNLAARFADERQVQIHSRSGNLAFITVMLAAIGFALVRLARGESPDEMYSILVIGITARAVTGLLMGGELRNAASIIIIVVGLVAALFVFVSDGLSGPSLLVGSLALVLASLGIVAFRWPRVVAAVLAVSAVGFVFFFHLYNFRPSSLAMWIVTACLLIAAACLYRGRAEESDNAEPRSRTAQIVGLSAAAVLLVVLFAYLSIGEKSASGTLNSAGQAVSGPVDVDGVKCVGRITYYPGGKLKSCVLAAEDTLSGQVLPKGTVVTLTPEGALDWCFLQQDTEIQGHLCKGKGHGWMTCFYPNGKLRLAWLGRDEIIQEIPVAEYSWWADVFGGGAGVHFWEDGNLKRARISRDCTVDGKALHKGQVVTLDRQGHLTTEESKE